MAKRNVLLLEDEPSVRRVFGRLLAARPSIRLETASCLREAREKLEAERFDLLISDIRLPDGSGWNAVRQFRDQNPYGPVIVITGSPQEEDDLRAQVEDVQFIPKPFDVKQILKAIDDALRPGPAA